MPTTVAAPVAVPVATPVAVPVAVPVAMIDVNTTRRSHVLILIEYRALLKGYRELFCRIIRLV